MMFRLCSSFLLLTFVAPSLLAQVQISEFMASNTRTVTDDYGQYEDWIEIYNFSTTNVVLLDWALTDSSGNLSKWRFPNTNLPPRTHLVVWASNRDRKSVGAPLHTNFKLDAGGEYLALVRPDGTVASQFSPEFPAQVPDVSYGFGTEVANWSLVSTGTVGRAKVPLDDSLDLIWFTTNLNDSGWTRVTNGIGFETGAGEFPTNVPGDVFADGPVGFWRLNELNTNTAAANSGSLGAAGNGQFKGGMLNGLAGPRPTAFPGFESANYAARFNGSNSTVDVAYSAALNPTGPFTLECWVRPARLNTRQCPVSSINFTTSSRAGYLFYQSELNVWEFRLGNNTTTYVANLAGGTVQQGVWHHLVGVYDGSSATLYVDGANVGSIALSGAFVPNSVAVFRLGATSSSSSSFYFSGDVDEVAVFSRALSAAEIAQRYEIAATATLNYGALIKSDVRAAMSGVNSSIYYRLPFTVSNAADVATLAFRVKYDDGFTAFLNGVPVLTANAPSLPVWSSAAQSRRATTDALQFEEYDLSGRIGALKNGTNVLALQGLNVAVNNPDFLLLPELEVSTTGEYQVQSRFFVVPTPGDANGGGSDDLGPIIARTGFWPPIPGTNDSITVTCRVVQAFAPVAGVTLNWRVMYGATNSATMFDDGLHGDGPAGDGVYGALITNKVGANWTYTAGQMVRWYINSADTLARSSRWPLFEDPAASAEYLGTVIQPSYVTSQLPVVHLFVSNYTAGVGVDNANKTGGRATVYFDGELYDNVFMKARGNSTIGYLKKSHSVDFNREHQFRHPGPGGRVRKTSWTADYPDPTYMRQGLSLWLCEEMGAPGPYYYPMRLQMNGAFYQLANHNDLHGEELLERLGYDPNGALYNAAGTVVPGQFSTGGFDKKTRQWDGNTDYQTLAGAISENLAVGQRRTNIFDLLDLPQVINYLAAARFVHENDDVWANMSLYHDNDGDGLWRIIPFDMNLSWGAAYVDAASLQGIQVTNDSVKSFPLYGSSQAVWTSGGNWNRIYDVIFQVPQTREMFLRRMRTLLDSYVKPPGTPTNQLVLEPLALAWRDLIGVEAQTDRATWGWPAMGGQCNFTPGIEVTNGVDILIHEFIAKRRAHFFGKHSVTNLALAVGITKADNAGIPLDQPTNPVVAIHSWDYNPASGNQDHEYVCLTNANSYAVDISGWKLDGGASHRMHPGTVIPPNSSLYLTPNVVAFRGRTAAPRGGMGLFVQGNYSGHLNAWGESMTLADAAGQIVSSNSFAGLPSAAQRYLRVTEIMYNPSAMAGNATDPQLFEYIELKNISTDVSLSLSGIRFTNGIYFSFTGSAVTTLLPGQSVLVVRDPVAFAGRYGTGFNIAGQYTGSLDNAGETLRLEDAVGEKILEFAYNNSWYPITDGLGFSLIIVDEQVPWSAWGDKASWKASGYLDGSPGMVEPNSPAIAPIRVNEVLAHTDLPEVDTIELYNPTATNANVGGWLLTDDFYTPAKYWIPAGTTIPAGGYITISANEFGTGANGFLLSEYGEQAFLFSADASTNLTGYVHGYLFSVSPNGVSFGRYLTSQGREHFVLQSATSLGTNNAAPRVGPIVISEIMYHPSDLTNGADNDLDEYIELQNITGTNVPLYCTFTSEPGYGAAARTNTWRLRDAVDFDFPTNQTLVANNRLLVVGFDPTNTTQLAAFRALYNVAGSVAVYGPWKGKLDNSSDSVELKSPDKPDVTGTNILVPYFMVDEVNYGDGPVWPSHADGLGNSIQRITLAAYGNDPTNWVSGGPTAGRVNSFNLPPQVSLVSPDNDAAFNRSQTITISASASDSDGTVDSVEFYASGNLLGIDNASPWSYAWSGAPYGVHSLTARAVDNGGSLAQSAAISITVTSQPPTVALNNPVAGALVVAGASVPITATAMDADGSVVGVDLYANGSLIASLTAAPRNFNWVPAVSGNWVITAIARDDSGASSLPASSSIFVQASAANPVLVSLGSAWRYLDNGIDQGSGWMVPDFPDSVWPAANGKFGFYNNNTGLGKVLSYGTNAGNKYPAYYFRKTVVVSSLSGITNLFLETLRDDGVAVYLNGAPLYRNNLPAGTLAYAQLATNCADNGMVLQTALLSTNGLVLGTNILAAEIHQSSLGSSDAAFDLKLTLLGVQTGPGIVQQPQSQQVQQNASATFAVGAAGSDPLAYQWRFNGANISGATGSSYTLAAAQPSQSGLYSVVVTNAIGSAVSSDVTLTVTVVTNTPISLAINQQGSDLVLAWAGGQPPFQVQSANDLDSGNWQDVGSATTNRTMTIVPSSNRALFRVRGTQ